MGRYLFFELCTVLMFVLAEILKALLFKRLAWAFEQITDSGTALTFWVSSVQLKIDMQQENAARRYFRTSPSWDQKTRSTIEEVLAVLNKTVSLVNERLSQV